MFRVLATEIPTVPGIRANVTVELAGIAFPMKCQAEDIDPPDYTRLQLLATQQLLGVLEERVRGFRVHIAGTEAQMERLRDSLPPATQHRERVLKAAQKAMGKGETDP